MPLYFKETDRMCDVISEEHYLLQTMSRFGIPLGFGEKSVEEVCREQQVDTNTFLAVANFIKLGEEATYGNAERISVRTLIRYLKHSHTYFLDFRLPDIRRGLLGAVDCSAENKIAFLILKFFDEFYAEVRKHMKSENDRTFPYVEHLLDGQSDPNYNISMYSRNHEAIDSKLQELKNIIIKYYQPGSDSPLLNNVLFDIFNCEADLHTHNQVEDLLFVPAVEILERKIMLNEKRAEGAANMDETSRRGEQLSERELEVVKYIVKGLTNKEIAELLFISINTVLTHRKNIARKLRIRSVSGLTIYAIAAGIVNLEEVNIQ